MNSVRQLLKVKGSSIYTISRNATVFDGMRIMAEKNIGALIVMNDNKPVGVCSERDVIQKVGALKKDPDQTLIEEVMTKTLTTVTPNQTVRECMVLLTEKHMHYLLVMDKENLVGLISIGDIVKDMFEELEFLVNQLTAYISGLR